MRRSGGAAHRLRPLNYQEISLAAARALQQINNQVRQLQNQAQIILRMDQNLLRLGSSDLTGSCNTPGTSKLNCAPATVSRCDCRRPNPAYEQLFPRQVSAALPGR